MGFRRPHCACQLLIEFRAGMRKEPVLFRSPVKSKRSCFALGYQCLLKHRCGLPFARACRQVTLHFREVVVLVKHFTSITRAIPASKPVRPQLPQANEKGEDSNSGVNWGCAVCGVVKHSAGGWCAPSSAWPGVAVSNSSGNTHAYTPLSGTHSACRHFCPHYQQRSVLYHAARNWIAVGARCHRGVTGVSACLCGATLG